MKSKKKKLDLIIYLSLFAAIICVGISAFDYANSLSAEKSLKSEVKEAIQEMKNTDPVPEVNPEPTEGGTTTEPFFLEDVDKPDLIKKHIDEILDNWSRDQLVNWKQIKSWDNYEVYDVKFVKEVTTDYYTYQFKLKISGGNPDLPTDKSNDLSSEGNTVIILNANFARNQAGYFYCKTLEKPQEILK